MRTSWYAHESFIAPPNGFLWTSWPIVKSFIDLNTQDSSRFIVKLYSSSPSCTAIDFEPCTAKLATTDAMYPPGFKQEGKKPTIAGASEVSFIWHCPVTTKCLYPCLCSSTRTFCRIQLSSNQRIWPSDYNLVFWTIYSYLSPKFTDP